MYLLAQLTPSVQPSLVQTYGPALIAALALVYNGFMHYKASLQSSATRDAEILSLRDWTKQHEKEAKQRDEQIKALGEIAASLKATVEGQDKRIALLEDDLKDRMSANRRAHRG